MTERHLEDWPGDETPVVAGEVVGWRAWVVLHGRSYREPRLRSLFYDVVWPTDRWLEADEGCSGAHGICAARSREQLAGMTDYMRSTTPRYADGTSRGELRVIGEVGLAGVIVPGERGYRAERARVVSIVLPYVAWDLLEGLRRAYRVPVTLGNVLVNAEGGHRGHRA